MLEPAIKLVATQKMFGGHQSQYKHFSDACQCEMTFSIYLPPQADSAAVPVLYWLSGLTCTDENFVAKAGAQRVAALLGMAIIMPDTSPRGENVSDDPDGAWDFGLGAGFYVNATEAPYSQHYKMYDYIVTELPSLINSNFPVDSKKQSISGHSMGGHGALTIALRNPGSYQSVSAFAPICAPNQCPWGQKAFSGYFGQNRALWHQHDATLLVDSATERLPILIDQGDADGFLVEQLLPALFEEACHRNDYPLELRMQTGYDHSYFFIATFIEDHLNFHAKALGLID